MGPAAAVSRLIYFSPIPWASYAQQRPHFFVRHLLDAGVVSDILWVEPYPTRLPKWVDLFRHASPALGRPAPRVGHLEILRVPALPLEPLPGGVAVNHALLWRGLRDRLRAFADAGRCAVGVGRPSALALWAMRSLPHGPRFFDAMDDFPAFYGALSARAMASTEQAVSQRADYVFCSSHALLEKFAPVVNRALLVPNAYPMAGLAAPLPPADRTIVGYLGTMGAWFDWGLVIEIAHALPALPVRLIGPQTAPPPRSLPPNVEIRPECPREEGVEHVRRFAVGLIPFRRNRLTAGVDPVKYYEYAAQGVQVWSTAFGEMALRGDRAEVELVASGSDWEELYYAKRLGHPPTAESIAAFRRENDWAARFAVVTDCLAT